MLARREIAGNLKPGTHACTFGGNPISAAAGIAMIETIEADGLLEQAQNTAALFAEHLARLKDEIDSIREIRQAGLMIGIDLEFEGAPVVAKALEQGLLINCTHETVLRLLPAMTIQPEQVDRAMQILSGALLAQVQQLSA